MIYTMRFVDIYNHRAGGWMVYDRQSEVYVSSHTFVTPSDCVTFVNYLNMLHHNIKYADASIANSKDDARDVKRKLGI